MSNILHSIDNIVRNPVVHLMEHFAGSNRINNVGYALEEYIKDAFGSTIGWENESDKNERRAEVFSWSGTQNNPPDIIISGGDAIEVKKIQSPRSSLALNSSYPKSKLHADSQLLTQGCRECEVWEVKDIIYAIGYVNQNSLRTLWMVYGDCYAADREIYERMADRLTSGITNTQDIEFSRTRELGRVNRVDPLGITYLRIRGMWGIDNPSLVFNYVHVPDLRNSFNLAVIMREEKYNSFSEEDKNLITENDDIAIRDVRINNPNNPAVLLNTKLITFSI